MKIFKSLHVVGGIILGMSCLGAYAGIENCMDNYVHCAYSTDQSSDNMGNYIKFSANGQSGILCVPYGSGMSEDNIMISQDGVHLGKNSWQLSVCSDLQCKKSVTVVDNFFLKALAPANFQATPPTYPFKMSGYFPAIPCNVPSKQFPLR